MLGSRTCARSLLVSLAVMATLSLVAVAEEEAGATTPAWFEEYADFMTRGGGIFHADNSAYRTEEAPWDAYGLEWKRGPSGRTLHGRLFGLQGGEEGETFWEFYSFWQPDEGKTFVYQVAWDGTVGIGTLEPPDAEGKQRLEQTFYHVDGGSYRIAHTAHRSEDTQHVESFVWSEGSWKPRRTYLWARVKTKRASRVEHLQ